MQKIQKEVEKLHAMISEALVDETNGLLTACYLGIRGELEALEMCFAQMVVEDIAKETVGVNDMIREDWNDESKQINPNVPHQFDVEDVEEVEVEVETDEAVS